MSVCQLQQDYKKGVCQLQQDSKIDECLSATARLQNR